MGWSVLVFGAPGALLGLLVCVAGALGRSGPVLVLGGLFLVPSSIYLGGHFWPLLALPLFPWAAASLIRRLNQGQALLFLLPNAVAVAFMLSMTLKNLARPG